MTSPFDSDELQVKFGQRFKRLLMEVNKVDDMVRIFRQDLTSWMVSSALAVDNSNGGSTSNGNLGSRFTSTSTSSSSTLSTKQVKNGVPRSRAAPKTKHQGQQKPSGTRGNDPFPIKHRNRNLKGRKISVITTDNINDKLAKKVNARKRKDRQGKKIYHFTEIEKAHGVSLLNCGVSCREVGRLMGCGSGTSCRWRKLAILKSKVG